jgi:septum formation protein
MMYDVRCKKDDVRWKIILASNSPRRKELLAGLDLQFEVRVLQDIDESYPHDLPTLKIAEFISKKKADAYVETMADDELVITADTVVILGDEVMGKPHDEADAKRMLGELSGRTHQVATGVTLSTKERQMSFSVVTDVTFKQLSADEIDYYVRTYHPMDKAGAYGIQEWIGYIGVTALKGSYFNVMGLPVQRIYEALKTFSDSKSECGVAISDVKPECGVVIF